MGERPHRRIRDTKIKRSDFGLTWNAALETGGFVVGEELKIEIEVSLIKS
jgi:polyisoprenoid-binding protein YceI